MTPFDPSELKPAAFAFGRLTHRRIIPYCKLRAASDSGDIAVALAADLRRRYDGGMYESFDDPPPQPQRYNALQYLIAAAAGCVIASFVAVGVVIWLTISGSLSSDSWQAVFKIVASAPILGAVSGILVLARKPGHS
jgi:hypothetical protein